MSLQYVQAGMTHSYYVISSVQILILIMGQDFLDSIYGSIYKNIATGWVGFHGLKTI